MSIFQEIGGESMNSIRTSVFALFFVISAGCDGKAGSLFRSTVSSVGVALADAAPLTTDLLIDDSMGSTFTQKGLGMTFDVVLPQAAAIPGSVTRLWVLGEDVASTRLVATQTSTAPSSTNKAARNAHQNRFIKN